MLKILIIIILLCTGCTNSVNGKNNYDNKIIIESIKIENEIHVSGIKEEVKGIVMFSEYGRPDIEGSNTIIGAHSGYGSNAYFNLLSKVDVGNEIILYYDNKKYIYLVEKVYEINEKDTSPLNKNEYSKLTIMTCKMGDSSKRIIVEASTK